MATHSSVLAWRVPGTGEPDGLPSMGSHRVGQDWSNLAAAVIHYIRLFDMVSICFLHFSSLLFSLCFIFMFTEKFFSAAFNLLPFSSNVIFISDIVYFISSPPCILTYGLFFFSWFCLSQPIWTHGHAYL